MSAEKKSTRNTGELSPSIDCCLETGQQTHQEPFRCVSLPPAVEAPNPHSCFFVVPVSTLSGAVNLIPQPGAHVHILPARRLVKCKAATFSFPSKERGFLPLKLIRVDISPSVGRGTAWQPQTMPNAHTDAAPLTLFIDEQTEAQGGTVTQPAIAQQSCSPYPPASPVNALGLCAARTSSSPVWRWRGGPHAGLGGTKMLEFWIRNALCCPTDKKFQSIGSGLRR